jgi:hypothetical protein
MLRKGRKERNEYEKEERAEMGLLISQVIYGRMEG